MSGDVLLRRVTARRIDAGSVSGHIKLEEVTCERVGVSSTTGGVSFSGPLARNGRYELKSLSGEVRVLLPAASGFELEAESFSGTINTNDFDIRGTRSKRTVRGTVGDGSAVLDLTTFSGSIVISKR